MPYSAVVFQNNGVSLETYQDGELMGREELGDKEVTINLNEDWVYSQRQGRKSLHFANKYAPPIKPSFPGCRYNDVNAMGTAVAEEAKNILDYAMEYYRRRDSTDQSRQPPPYRRLSAAQLRAKTYHPRHRNRQWTWTEVAVMLVHFVLQSSAEKTLAMVNEYENNQRSLNDMALAWAGLKVRYGVKSPELILRRLLAQGFPEIISIVQKLKPDILQSDYRALEQHTTKYNLKNTA